MKWEGRVGEAALYGCGCWAQSAGNSPASAAVACSTSGIGEEIIRSMLASTVCQTLTNVEREVQDCAINATQDLKRFNARRDMSREAGFIALRAHFCNNCTEEDDEEDPSPTTADRHESTHKSEGGTTLMGELFASHTTNSFAYGFIDQDLQPRVRGGSS